ncbi:MAG: oxygen-independent coproporphyrinogen III oxidase-like protein, partial [Granulosicoccaceae bacterium]
LQDLQCLIALEPEHVSWYQLTLEPNTLFHQQVPPGMPDDDVLADLHQEGLRYLAQSGYQRYEVSAFAKPDKQCQHNLNYWRFGDYLAAGAGAHGKLSTGDQVMRVWKQRHPRQYMSEPDPSGERFVVEREQLTFEFMLNALRLVDGVEASLYERHTGLALREIEPVLRQLEARELLQPLESGRLACTPLGLNYLDDVLQSFLVSS